MPIKHIILAVIVAAVWGSNFIFVKLGVSEIPPLFLCALRFFFACFPAIFFAPWPGTSLKGIATYGLIMFALQFSLIFSGFAAGMLAGMGSVLMQTQIFFSVLFAIIFLSERPSYWQVIGALVAFSGIGWIAFHVDSNMTLLGFLLVTAGAATWGIGNLITKKMSHVNMISLIAYGSLFACVPLFLLSFLVEGQERIVYSLQHFSWILVVSLTFIVYVSTWVGYGLWNYLLKHYPVTTVVPFSLLVPIFGILSSSIILGESLEPWKIIASILVVSGLGINLIGQRMFIMYRKYRRLSESSSLAQD